MTRVKAIFVGLVTCLAVGDACTVWADCNFNGVADAVDLSSGSSVDCNVNGVPDECEIAPVTFGLSGPTLTLEGQPRSSHTGDVDGDGQADLVILHRALGVSRVTVFRGSPDRDLAPITSELTVGTVIFSRVADLDSDGEVEFLGLARGLAFVLDFQETGFVPVLEFTVPTLVDAIAAADLNDDGLADLITSSRSEETIGVYAVQEAGSVGEPSVHSAGGGTAVAVQVGDMDGDGDDDLVSANSSPSGVAVLLNSDGVLDDATTRSIARRPTRLVLGDVDGDGALDAVVGTRERIFVYRNTGSGDLVSHGELEIPSGDLFLDDLDGDGHLDLAATTSTRVLLFLNPGDGRFGGAQAFSNDALLVRSGDLDGNGTVDLALTKTAPDEVEILWNGVGTPPLDFDQSTISINAKPHFVTKADFNRDGLVDVVTGNGADGSWSILRNRGDGSLSGPITHIMQGPNAACSRRTYFIAPGDYDDDGNTDVAMCPRCDRYLLVALNRAGGIQEVRYPVAGASIVAASADFDDDGDLDLVSASGDSTAISVLMNDSAGGFFDRRDVDIGGSSTYVLARDLDRDGDADLAVARGPASDVVVLRNNGDGTFGDRNVYPVTGNPLSMESADLNADGDIDLFVGNEGSNDVNVLLARGEGLFDASESYPTGRVAMSITSADIDGDGFLDLVTADTSETATLLFGSENGRFPRQARLAIGSEPRAVVALDLEMDGDVDLVACNRRTAEVTVLVNQASAAQLVPDYLERICTELDFHNLSTPSQSDPVERSGKYLVPARDDDALLPTLFQNVKRFSLHLEFLRQAFAERFATLDPKEYRDFVERRATRDYYVGIIKRLRRDGKLVYGFQVAADLTDPRELLRVEEVRRVYDQLVGSFGLVPLGYLPDSAEARDAVAGWVDPGFSVWIENDPELVYEPYTLGLTYGRVRVMDRASFEIANGLGQLGFQTITVLDFAPRDIFGVVAGVVTADRQGGLSHLAIRTARRGTPNAFVREARAKFAPFDGELVRLELTDTGYNISAATLEAAEAFWLDNRPQLSVFPSLDLEFRGLPTLEEIAAMEVAGEDVVARVGGKAANLARLQTILDGPREQYRERGFAIPLSEYIKFLRSNRIASGLEPARQVTYEEYLLELFDDEQFRTTSEFRFQRLEVLHQHMRDFGVVDPGLIESIAARVGEVMGSESTVRVRFRSSSNAEDALEFNGAGLYDSTSGCAADDLDGDAFGPSRCDPTRNKERTIARALKLVWSSLWNFGAFEERAFYAIPQDLAGMGILVNRTFIAEAANGVAFTGNPFGAQDGRYVISVQVGEASVVNPEPDVEAEKNLIEIRDGEVVDIIRITSSSLLPDGVDVLSDGQLTELGELMAHIDREFALNLGEHDRQYVLLDLEFKFMPDGELAVKQIRPFLLSGTVSEAPTLELVIPPETTICGGFFVAGSQRGPRQEYELKSTVKFISGVFNLPTVSDTLAIDIVDELRIGATRQVASPAGPGRFRVRRPLAGGSTYQFTFDQNFVLNSGQELRFVLAEPIGIVASGSGPIHGSRTLDDGLLLRRPSKEVFQLFDGATALVRYGTCVPDTLPLFRIDVGLEGGGAVTLNERLDEIEADDKTGAAALVQAELRFGGDRIVVDDYWQLVYSASRHNTSANYWVILDPPLSLPGSVEEVSVVAIEIENFRLEGLPEATYLDRNFEVIRRVPVTSFLRREVSNSDPLFRRGDVTAEGTIDISDAIGLLDFLFGEGAAPSCRKSGDANDDGRLNLSDVMAVVLHLFADRGPLAGQSPMCLNDPTPDGLGCERYAPCGG